MKNTARLAAVERRFPYLCKVLYFPNVRGDDPRDDLSHRMLANPMSWYLRSPMLPRVGDVIPYGQSLFAVTTVILEDCCSADAISKVDKQAGRIAERDETPKWHAVVWVGFWGNKELG